MVLDARSTRRLLEDIGDNDSVKVYSTGLRVVRKTKVEAEHITSVGEAIDSGLPPFNPSKFLKLCVEMSVNIGEERPSGFRAYRPQISVEGEWMYSHSLSDKFGGEPTNSNGSIVCDGSHPLVLKYGDKGTVELMLHFAEDEEGVMRFSNLGFRVVRNGRKHYRSLHPTNMRLSFEPELSRTEPTMSIICISCIAELNQGLPNNRKTTGYCNFTRLGGWVYGRHMKWSDLVYKTEFFKHKLLRINGWLI